MKEWLKDHALELISVVVTLVGVKGLTDFWSRLCEMFSSYSIEALFACGLAAAVAAIAAAFFMRNQHRRQLAAKDAKIAELEKRPTQEQIEALRSRIDAIKTERDDEFDLRRFSPEQKRAMLKCWSIEQSGEEGGIIAEWGNPVCEALVDAGVFRSSADRFQAWSYQFNFEPKWRKYLAEHIDDLESEAGTIESLD